MSSFRASLRSEDVAALGPAKALVAPEPVHLRERGSRQVHHGVPRDRRPRVRAASLRVRGHDPPILMARDGTMRELSEGGLVLGLIPDAEYSEACVELIPGTTLAIYTDGVTEAQNPAEEFFGRERLVDTLSGARAENCSRLLARDRRGDRTFRRHGAAVRRHHSDAGAKALRPPRRRSRAGGVLDFFRRVSGGLTGGGHRDANTDHSRSSSANGAVSWISSSSSRIRRASRQGSRARTDWAGAAARSAPTRRWKGSSGSSSSTSRSAATRSRSGSCTGSRAADCPPRT